MDTWNAPVEVSSEEEQVLKLCKKQKLWAFLRKYRHRILDDEVRTDLVRLFAPSGRGRPPVAPEQLALAMLLQVGFNVADHEVPTLTAVDRRWQMILDCMGETVPVFSQGTVFNFRERAREHGLMKTLLEKTVELARQTKGFSHKRLRAIFDSSPLVGAGRVEDTFNLLGRAIAQLVCAAAEEAGRDADHVARELEVSVVFASSVKAALDVDWRDSRARSEALNLLVAQFRRVEAWLHSQFEEKALQEPPLAEALETVEQILEQDTEPDPESPSGGDKGSRRVSKGTAKDRLVSLSDRDMRHGRKSKTKLFSGYKRHVAVDREVPGLICAVEVQAANHCEHEAAGPLFEKLEIADFDLNELQIDRGYLAAEEVIERHDAGLEIVCKPPTPRRSERFTKADFATDFESNIVTCPNGVVVPLKLDTTVRFPTAACRACRLRDSCLTPKARSRSLCLHPQERWYRQMAVELSTAAGRQQRRSRVDVEHALARVGAIQGKRARFLGRDKNQFDLERTAVVNNCYVLGRLFEQAA